MLRKRFLTTPAAAVVALALGLGGALVTTTAASAHTPSVTSDCQTLSVSLTQYAAQQAAVAGTSTTSYQRYSWTGGRTDTAPTEIPPSSNWQANTSNYKSGDPVDVAFQQGNGENASWFFWDSTVTTTAGTPAKTNTVTVTIDGVVVETAEFGQSFVKQYSLGDKYVAHSYSVAVVAHDDPGRSRGWTRTFTGTSKPCARPDVTVPVQLTYMTACAVDSTNTWRFRNPTSTPVTLSLSDGASHVAAPGDTFYETPRSNTTLTATWGGPGTGVVAGSTVKASGVDEVSDACAGPKPDTKVENGEWSVMSTDCDTREITETRTVTTTTYERVGNQWVGTPTTSSETVTRGMTEAELDEYCPVELEPAALEVITEWVVSDVDCDTREVTETRTVTTTPYVLVDREWELGEAVVTAEEQTRPMTAAELDENCPVDIQPAAVQVLGDWMVSGKDCDTAMVTESRTVSTTPYVLVDREWVAGSAVETTELRTRAMTDAERTALCPAVPVTPLGELPTLALTEPRTLALTGPSAALGGLGIAGLVALMAGLGLVLLRRPQPVSEEN